MIILGHDGNEIIDCLQKHGVVVNINRPFRLVVDDDSPTFLRLHVAPIHRRGASYQSIFFRPPIRENVSHRCVHPRDHRLVADRFRKNAAVAGGGDVFRYGLDQ